MPGTNPQDSKTNSKNSIAKPKTKTKSKPKTKSFFSRYGVVIYSALIIVFIFLALYIYKGIKDAQKLIYDGLNEEIAEESYPLYGLKQTGFFQDEYNFKSYDDGVITSKRGIDVSEHQGEIDWAMVKEEGVEFAFIRAGYRTSELGIIYEDAYFKYNIENAIANGIDVGVYFFSQAISVDESIEEAKFTIDLLQDYDISLPIVHDMEEVVREEDRIKDLTRDERTEIADAFCEIVENYGYDSMIYGNPSWLLTEINILKLSDRKIWLAHYSDTTLYPFRYEIWQYTDSGMLEGISEPVDLNIMFIRPD